MTVIGAPVTVGHAARLSTNAVNFRDKKYHAIDK